MIIPVRDGSALLARCLEPLLDQAEAVGGEVLVVDDASADDTAATARALGADVVEVAAPAGPYHARNLGWRSTSRDVVVFTDVRCRAHPGWLTAMTSALARPGRAIAGSEVTVTPGAGLARRASLRLEPMSATRSVAHPYLPFVPTCALAIRRATLEAVDGFREVESGGDVDLCWRVQLHLLGEVGIADGAAMDWEPRASVRGLLSQYHRYGRNSRWLQDEYADLGGPDDQVAARWRTWGVAGRDLLRRLPHLRPAEWAPATLESACRVAAIEGHRSGPR